MDLIAYLEAKLVENDMDGNVVVSAPFIPAEYGWKGYTRLTHALIAAYVREYVLQAQASQNSIH